MKTNLIVRAAFRKIHEAAIWQPPYIKILMKKLIACTLISCFSFHGQSQSLVLVMENYFKMIGGSDKVAQINASKEVSFNWFKRKQSDNPDSSNSTKTQTILREPLYKRFISFDEKGNWSNEFYYNEKGSVLAMGSVIQKSSDRIEVSACLSRDLLKWYEKNKLKYLWKENFNGQEYDVVSKTDNGKTEFFFFNTKTHLLDASKNKDWPDRITYYSVYKETNFISHPFLVETYDHDDVIYRKTTETFEYNPVINNKIFFFNESEYEERNRPKVKYESVTLEASEEDIISFTKTNFADRRVFIDMWATWCAPCKKEFRSYDSAYYSLMDSNNISLVYLSIDKDADKKKWEQDIEKLGLKGYHARANKKLVETLKIEIFDGNVITIPRYILIDEAGNILSKNFLRPSDPEFRKRINKTFNKIEN